MPSNPNESRRGNHFSGGGQSNNNANKTPNTARPSETAEFMSAYFTSAPRSARTQQARTAHPKNKNNDHVAGNPPCSNTATPRESTRIPAHRISGNECTPHRQQPPQRSRLKGKTVAAVIGTFVALVVVIGGVCGFTMYRDYKDITARVPALTEQAHALVDAVKEADGDTLRNTAAGIATEVNDIHNKLEGTPWQIASFIPILGQDVRSVRTVVDQADNLCQYALIPVCDDLGNIKLSNLLENGAINVDLFTSLVNTLSQVAPVVQQSADIIEELPDPNLSQLAEPMKKVRDLVGTANTAVIKLNEVAPYLPQMLGANGEVRNYLIIAQSNAELRSTGGFPGSAGVMTVANGSITLGGFSSFADMNWYDTPGFGVTDEELTIFGDGAGNDNRIGRIPADTNIIPDFARASQIISAMWTDQHGGTINGVIAIDPVFLQSMLALTGGFNTSSGVTVDGSNAAAMLLHDAYNTFSTSNQDLFFAEVAGTAFSQLTSSLGNIDFTQFINTITSGIENHRLQIWMANPDEETLMAEIGCDGTIPTDPSAPELGVYVSDDTYSKIAWFLSLHSTINSSVKNADGTTTYNVTTTLTNNLDPNDAYNQVDYIVGSNSNKRNRSDMVDKVYLFAPAGGNISDVTVDGYVPAEFPLKEGTYNGNQVWYVTLQTCGLETSTITYNVTAAADAADLTIRQTPTAQEVAGWQ